MRISYKILVGKSEGKRHNERIILKWILGKWGA
jgi:hypothetical protein